MNRPHLGVRGSEPVRTGVLPLGGAELGEASACGKRLSAQPALGPTLAAGDMRWRAGEHMRKTTVPQWEWGGPWHSRCFPHTLYSLFLASAVALSSSSLSLPLHLAELLSIKATSSGKPSLASLGLA